MSYSGKELQKETGFSTFAIRHWVNRGVLPPARREGASSRYGEDHKIALLAIKKLVAQGLRGKKLRDRLHGLSTEQLRALAGIAPPPAPRPPAPSPPTATPDDKVEALLCMLAERADVSPRALRPALVAMLAEMHAAGIGPADAASALARRARPTPYAP